MNILFSEGSSTSARQSLSALGPLGYRIDVCDPQRLGLGRFSRYTHNWLLSPSFARQPGEYLDFLAGQLRRSRYDVLLAIHDQVFLLARYRDELARLVALAVPDLDAVQTVQSKRRFADLLDRLHVPQPPYRVVSSLEELSEHREFPCFVKRDVSTAGRGVWRIESREQMNELIQQLRSDPNVASANCLLVQQETIGEYCVVQCVFQLGRLVAAHCYARRARGVGGSAHARESIVHPAAVADAALIGKELQWQGAMHLEFFDDAEAGRRQFIEANPRIGETMNATLAGLNLCDVLVQVSLGMPVTPLPASRPGVRTHSLLTSLLGLAERGGSRGQLAGEMFDAWQQWDPLESTCRHASLSIL